MKLVYINPNPSGAYPPIQEGNFSSVPEGMAVWPEDLKANMAAVLASAGGAAGV